MMLCISNDILIYIVIKCKGSKYVICIEIQDVHVYCYKSIMAMYGYIFCNYSLKRNESPPAVS